MGKRKRGRRRASRASVVFAWACLVSVVAMGIFFVSVPLLNSASTAGNVAGYFSVMAFAFVMWKTTAVAVRKYREASR